MRLSAWDFGPVLGASPTHHHFRFGLLHRQHGLRSSFRTGGGAMLSGCTFPDSSLPWVFCCHPIARVVVRAAVCLPSSPPGCGTSSTSFKWATAHDTLLPFQRSWSSIAPAYLVFLLASPFWDTRSCHPGATLRARDCTCHIRALPFVHVTDCRSCGRSSPSNFLQHDPSGTLSPRGSARP